MRGMGQASNRVYVVDLVEDGVLYPERADEFLKRMGAVLTEVGGSMVVQAERHMVDQLGDEPIAVTTRLIGRWDSFSPIKRPEPEPELEVDEPVEG